LKTPAHMCWTTVHQRRKNPAAVAYVLLAVLGALEQSKGGLAGEGERVSDSILDGGKAARRYCSRSGRRWCWESSSVSGGGKRECWRRRTARGVFYTTGKDEFRWVEVGEKTTSHYAF
jgi:hypothetical protein